MKISPLKNSYVQFTSKSKQMRDLDDINRGAKAEFDGIPSSSYYMLKRPSMYESDKISQTERLHYEGALNVLLSRTVNMRRELPRAKTPEEIMALVKEYNIANCGERTLYLQEKLREMGIESKRMFFEIKRYEDAPLERYSRDMKDHVFVLINDKEDADWQEPATWGSKAIILDPWTGIAGYKDEALDEIKNYLKIDPQNEYLLFDRCYSDIECE